MEPHTELSLIGQRLFDLLAKAENTPQNRDGEVFYVSGPARDVYFAYERLRNAADYTQQHLLLRAAIERFLRRRMALKPQAKTQLAKELITELTNARYVPNGSITTGTLDSINHFVTAYSQFFYAITTYHGVDQKTASRWTYQITSVAIERLISPQYVGDAFVDFAYRHYLGAINRHDFAQATDQQFAAATFCAMQQALFNADKATALSCWVSLTCQQTATLTEFIKACYLVDENFDSPTTNKLSRLINRNGAPMRALRELITRQPGIDLANKENLLAELKQTTLEQYESTQKRLMHSIKRAVIFIIITKLLIGLLIEIPVDLVLFGHIAFVPLVLTLVVPVGYLLSATYSLRRPSARNTHTILDYASRIVYSSPTPVVYRTKQRRQNRGYLNAAYISLLVVVAGFIGLGLTKIGFHALHIFIFMLFLSATSLLRFRIVQAARELEIVDRQQSMFGVVGDLLYLPFIHLGQWLSDSYRQINFFAYVLDLAIEMPLKATLRALRTWVDFIHEKREEI